MQLLDMAGMDIYTSVASYLNPDLSTSSEVSSRVAARNTPALFTSTSTPPCVSMAHAATASHAGSLVTSWAPVPRPRWR